MAPSLAPVLSALLALTGNAFGQKYTLAQTINAENFFEEFIFNTTGTITSQPDDNWAWVQFQNLNDARTNELARVRNDEVYIGVDHRTELDPNQDEGRRSLRLVSRNTYKHGLLITRFSHFPAAVCGGWPSYWLLGEGPWPNAGEMDLYEGWNLAVANKPAFHVGEEKVLGTCKMHPTFQKANVISDNCDNTYADQVTQWPFQGCQSEEPNGIWASDKGGTQALEWTSEYIKLFSWKRGEEPANIDDDQPDVKSWGAPSVNVDDCDIDRHFAAQRIIFTLPFCGDPVGTPLFWSELDGGSGITCDKHTGKKTCIEHVASNPKAFKDFYFQVQDIRYFNSTQPSIDPASPTVTPARSSTAGSRNNMIINAAPDEYSGKKFV
ncbi:hypothetical protein RJ55_07804 [Drechmeria coniospora]|nr:hypothetical protein RJ55_07804 [Drechmeria coniospora]